MLQGKCGQGDIIGGRGDMRTVIFDLDGTLVDTSVDLVSAANACFCELGHGNLLDPVADAATAFRGGRAMLTLGFERLGQEGGDRVMQAYPRFVDLYWAYLDATSAPYPGVVKAVTALRDEGYALGICTNKPEGLAEELMTRLGLRALFGSLIGADTLSTKKPDPAPYVAAVDRAGGKVERSILIGDTVTDRKTAKAAGVPCALVTFGPEGRGVETLKPDELLDHYDDLGALVSRLIG